LCSSEEYTTSESRDERHITETLHHPRTRIPPANTYNTLRQDIPISPCLSPSRHDLLRGRRPGSAPRSRILMTTVTNPRACLQLWIQGMMDAVVERWPASLAMSGHRALLSRPLQDSLQLIQWQETLKMQLLMMTRASGRTLRRAPGVLNSLPTNNGTASAATRGAAR